MSGDSQALELLPPDTEGFYTSNVADWVPLCPQLRDSSIRLYWILRSLVIEKYGPVRKLTLAELCHLLPAKPVQPGEAVKPSSLSRIRSLIDELTSVGLVTTPDGKPIKTSSRAKAAAGALRMRINDRPTLGYEGPRNAFAVLDAVKAPAARTALETAQREAELEAARRAVRRGIGAGQISDPQREAGQISSPPGQISSPRGQISVPHAGVDLLKRDAPLSLSTQSFRSAESSVPPSFRAGSRGTEGRTEGASAATTSKELGAGADVTPGVQVLNAIAQECGPEFLLTGKTLTDQAEITTKMLSDGWSAAQIRHVVAGPGWPGVIKTSREAIIAGRLRRAADGPAPAAAPPIPGQASSERGDSWERGHMDAAETWTPPVWTGDVPRVLVECEECGSPAVADGHKKCPTCLGWPECVGTCGIAGTSKRRVRPDEPSGLCSSCLAWQGSLEEGIDLAQREMALQNRPEGAGAPF
ncbi:hypothetical protein AB0F96_26830 [Streptomyces sp. NPDC023998]|uniref:hypothetical protein n=1 Tax=Streptomyces sp. NPDC023998 TaxID=3154597 RepID=UPI0033E274EA